MDKFRNKYRIKSARRPGYDYGSNSGYYVTICTKNREHSFGEIVMSDGNKKTDVDIGETGNYPSLRSTIIGKIARKYWMDIPNHFPFVIVGEFVIMPDHIHGILFFNKSVAKTDNYSVLPWEQWQSNKFGTQSQNLGSVLRGFKSTTRRYANENNIEFAWQDRFYDHIIRDKNDYIRIVNYIKNNPQRWIDNEELLGRLV